MSPTTISAPTRLLTVDDAITAAVILGELDAGRPGFAWGLAARAGLTVLGRPELEGLCSAYRVPVAAALPTAA